MLKAQLLACLLLLATTPAAAEEHRVKKKFSVEPPEGWRMNDPGVSQAMAKSAAKAIGLGGMVGGKPPLAVFLSPAQTQGFASNLNIREVDQVLSADEKMVEEYRKNMGKGFAGIPVKMEKVEIISLPTGKRALRGEWSYTLQGIPLLVVQVMYPGRGVTFISTYTTHASAFASERTAIEASLESFRNLEPWYAWITGRPIVLYGLIGAGVGLLGALLFRRRSA